VTQVIAIVALATYFVVLFGINLLKGKVGFALAGFVGFLHFLWWIGAIRLAKPNSWWARRFYVGDREDKLQKAIARHGDPSEEHRVADDVQREGWLSGTVPRGEGVPVQRLDPDTGQWVVVYVPRDPD
jgi:hypothetical protein